MWQIGNTRDNMHANTYGNIRNHLFVLHISWVRPCYVIFFVISLLLAITASGRKASIGTGRVPYLFCPSVGLICWSVGNDNEFWKKTAETIAMPFGGPRNHQMGVQILQLW